MGCPNEAGPGLHRITREPKCALENVQENKKEGRERKRKKYEILEVRRKGSGVGGSGWGPRLGVERKIGARRPVGLQIIPQNSSTGQGFLGQMVSDGLGQKWRGPIVVRS